MNLEKINVIQMPQWDQQKKTIQKCSPLRTHFRNKPIVLGFPDIHHATLVKSRINMVEPHIRIYSRHPENISAEIQSIVANDTVNLPSIWMDSNCFLDFYKYNSIQSAEKDITFLYALRIPLDDMDTNTFLFHHIENKIGISFPYDFIYEDSVKIRFQGQIIYV